MILTDIGIYHYLIIAVLLFSVGLWGVLTQRNVIRILMCVELMLNAVNINFVAFNNYLNPNVLSGQIFSIFVLTVSAAEAAVGLAIVIALFRGLSTVDIEAYDSLQG